jgi:hypothetical protein
MRNALIVVPVLVVGLVLFVASRPAAYHVERSATIEAAPESLYTRIADFHRWEEWSPWAKLDAAMKIDFSGAEAGPGAVYHWVGNSKVGEGRMTLTDAQPPGRAVIRLEFLKPFASVCTTTFTLAPEGSGTHVTWTMDGRNDFVGKAMCLVMNMDKTVGPDFERGLAGLGRSVDTAAPAPGADSLAVKS